MTSRNPFIECNSALLTEEGTFELPQSFHNNNQRRNTNADMISTRNNCNETSSMHDSFSTVGTFTDDYGEPDVSLRSYRSETLSPPCSCSNMSQEEANDLLHERIADLEYVSELNVGKCTFMAGGDHKLEISIRGDGNAVVVSTVVQSLDHSDVLQGHKKSNQCQGLYSLMTLMMKHNAILKRAAAHNENEGGHIGLYDGKFVFFANLPMTVLSSKRKLERVLDDLILKAVEISKDFAKVQESAKAKRLRRKFLIRAYNKTLL
jgi:hypothetical protein